MSLLRKLLNHSKLAQYETEQKKKYKQYVKTKKTDIKLFCKSEPEIYEDVLTELRKSFRRSKRKSSSNIQKDPAILDAHKASASNNLNSNITINQTDIIGNRTSSSARKDSIKSRTSIKQFRAPLPPQTLPKDVQNPLNGVQKSQDEKTSSTNETKIEVGTSKTWKLDRGKLAGDEEQIELNKAETSKSFSYTEQNDFLEHLDFELKNRQVSAGNLEPHGGAKSLEEATEPQPKPRRSHRSEKRNQNDASSKLGSSGEIEKVDDDLAKISSFGDGFSESLQEARNEHVQFNKNLQYDHDFEVLTHDISREGMTNYLPDVQNDVTSTLGSETESAMHTRSRKDSYTTIASDDTFYDCEDFKESGTWNGDHYKPSLEYINESDQLKEPEQFGVHQVLSSSIEYQIRSRVDDQSPTSCSSDDAAEPTPSGTGFEELYFKFETESYEPNYKERHVFGMNYIWSEPERHKSKEIIYTRPENDTYNAQSEQYFVKNKENHEESDDEYIEEIKPPANKLHSPIPEADASKLEDLIVMNEDIEDGWNALKLPKSPIKSMEMDTFQHFKVDDSTFTKDIKDIESTNLPKSTFDVKDSGASSFQNPKDVRSHLASADEEIEDETTTIEPIRKFDAISFQNLKNRRSIFNKGEDEIENDEESKLPLPNNKTKIFRQASLQYPRYKNDYVADTTNNEVTRRIKTNSFNNKPSRFSWEPERKYEPVFSSNLFDTYRDKFYTNETKNDDDKGQDVLASKLPENTAEAQLNAETQSKKNEFQEDLLQSFESAVLHRVKEEVFHRLKTEESNSKVTTDGESINEANFLDDPLKINKSENALHTKKDLPKPEDLPKSPKKVTFKLDEPYNSRYIGNNKFPKYSNAYANEKFPRLGNGEYGRIDEEVLREEPDVNAPKSLQEKLILRKLKLKKFSESDSEDSSGKFEEVDLPESFKKNLKLKKSTLNGHVNHDEVTNLVEEEDTNMPESLFRNLNAKKSKLNRFNGTNNVLHNGMSSQEYIREFEETDAPKSLLDHINVSKARLRKHKQGYGYKDDENISEGTISNMPGRLGKKVSFKTSKFNENTRTVSPNVDEASEEDEFEYKLGKNIQNNKNLKILKFKFEESEEKCDDPIEQRLAVTSLRRPILDPQLKRHSRDLNNDALRDESKFPDTTKNENISGLSDEFNDYNWESKKGRNSTIEDREEHNYESDLTENNLRSKDQGGNEVKFGNKNLQELSDILTSVNSDKDVYVQINTIEEIIMHINRKVNELDSKNDDDYPLLFHMLLQSMRIVSGLPYGLEQNLLDTQQNILSDIQNCISIMNNKKII